MIASGGDDGTIIIYESGAMYPIKQFQAHDGRVNDVCLSPDGRTLLSCGQDNVLALWSVYGDFSHTDNGADFSGLGSGSGMGMYILLFIVSLFVVFLLFCCFMFYYLVVCCLVVAKTMPCFMV